MKVKFITIFLILLPFFAVSQIKNEIWTDYIFNYYITPKLITYGDAALTIGETDIIGIRPSIKYLPTDKYQILGGLWFNYTFENENTVNNTEIIPWQGIKVFWPQTMVFTLKHFVRIEERYTTDTAAGVYEFQGAGRLRYLIGSDIDVWENASGSLSLAIPLDYEIFHSFNQNKYFIERDRIMLGATMYLNKTSKLEFSFILQRSGEGFLDLSPQKHIYRFRFIQTFFGRLRK